MRTNGYIHAKVYATIVEYQLHKMITAEHGQAKLSGLVHRGKSLEDVRTFQVDQGDLFPVYVEAITHVQEVEEAAHAYGWTVGTPPDPLSKHVALFPPALAFNRLRLANVTRCNQVFHPEGGILEWSPSDWATAMAGECGEACNEIKKLRRLDGADAAEDTPSMRAVLTEKVGKELADVVIYADLLAARLGINLGEAVIGKFNEVSERRGSAVKL